MTVLGVPADRVWLSGTSKGGSTALCAGMALGFGRVLVGEPYVSLGELLTKYASSQVVQGITLAITGRAEPPDRAWGNDIVPSRVRAGAPRFAGTVRVLCCRESGFWDEHVSALPPAFEAGGLAPERWTVEMVPGTAHGHIRVPYEEALAAELRAAPDAPPAGGGTEGPD